MKINNPMDYVSLLLEQLSQSQYLAEYREVESAIREYRDNPIQGETFARIHGFTPEEASSLASAAAYACRECLDACASLAKAHHPDAPRWQVIEEAGCAAQKIAEAGKHWLAATEAISTS